MFNLWKLFDATRDFRLWPLSRRDIWWVANIRTVWPMSHRDIWWVANIRIVWPMSHRDIRWVANIRTVWPMSHRDIWWVGRMQNHPPTFAPIVPMGRRTQRIRIFLPTNGRYATGCLTFGNYLMLPET